MSQQLAAQGVAADVAAQKATRRGKRTATVRLAGLAVHWDAASSGLAESW